MSVKMTAKCARCKKSYGLHNGFNSHCPIGDGFSYHVTDKFKLKKKKLLREADDKVHWTVEIAKELEKKPLKKDSYDLGVRITNLAKVDRKKRTSHCCCREPFKLLIFTHRDSGRRRVTRFVAICKTHFKLLMET